MDIKGIHLTPRNFIIVGNKAVLKTQSTRSLPGMLLIYADWCGHCVRFKPVFNKLCSVAGRDFVCASIESAELENSPKLSSSLNFKGFPSIKFFDKKGNIIGDYPEQYPREFNAILEYIQKVKLHSEYH